MHSEHSAYFKFTCTQICHFKLEGKVRIK